MSSHCYSFPIDMDAFTLRTLQLYNHDSCTLLSFLWEDLWMHMYTSVKEGGKCSEGTSVHIMEKLLFFFPVKRWERSLEIVHLSLEIVHLNLTPFKGIFNNLEATPWELEIFKNQCLRVISLFNLSRISFQSWLLILEAFRLECFS